VVIGFVFVAPFICFRKTNTIDRWLFVLNFANLYSKLPLYCYIVICLKVKFGIITKLVNSVY